MDKEQLRREVQENRARLQTEQVLMESNQILETLQKQPEFRSANVILCYVSFEHEVDTHSLIQSALESGKQVAVPKIIKKGSMEFYEIHSLDDLHPGRFGILEPDTTEPIAYDSTKQYTMIMPGLAFDKQLHRIGYGGGYYDRYLRNYKNENIITIALAFDFQVYENIPSEVYDYQPNILITPSKVLKTLRTKKKGVKQMKYLDSIGKKAKIAARELNLLGQNDKKLALIAASEALLSNTDAILKANAIDVENAKKAGMKESLIDRLSLTPERIASMAKGLTQVADLKDPIGEMISMENRPNGLQIIQKRIPIGVIGMIYESRPNVTADAFGLCFKTGNAVILRGGSDAIQSNLAIAKALQQGLESVSITKDAIQIIEDTSRETVYEFMKMNEYLDLLIPRGGAGLIRSVVENSTVPVIETGTGNCHVYVDESADFDMALDIIDNAKTQRLGVCNACESLVIHSSILNEFLPLLYDRLTEKQIVFRADERAREVCPTMETATEEDFYKEYLDRFISVKVVDSIDEAIAHINHYNTEHSETIVTKDYNNAMKFHNEIDAAAVYVNASTRFTDGNEFGFGAEIGISTQKLHARGPMGLLALTSSKYVIFGSGQIRP